jgi:hypothetical protein
MTVSEFNLVKLYYSNINLCFKFLDGMGYFDDGEEVLGVGEDGYDSK